MPRLSGTYEPRMEHVACPAPWPRVLAHNAAGRVEGARVTYRDQADEALRARMVGYQAGERDAFERLHEELAPILHRHLLRLARDPSRVDDLLQETFLQIHRARHTYDPAFPVPPWACAIARHVFLMDCRYRHRRADLAHQEPLDDATLPVAATASHEEALIAKSQVQHALSRLSESTRQSVLMHHLHGLTFREISRRLHIRGPALRARASRGMARLREALEDNESHRDDNP
ncbi:MAG: RNA polymerase sigma factor [Acidobacteria bacterium]|nr:MAG: RNA polymerase sigma factor [Acidobacteriota bacterium]